MVIICLYDEIECNKIKEELKQDTVKCKTYADVLPKPWNEIYDYEFFMKNTVNGVYEDSFNNKIVFEGDIPPEFRLRFNGVNNYVHIGKWVQSEHGLFIVCGTEAVVEIGDASTFNNVRMEVSWGELSIGSDCMFSFGITVRNTDGHHIFSSIDGHRINYTKSISIGNHVWIGQNAILCPGFQIGEDSIVGAGAVTSSKFPSNCIIVGNPAKILKRDVTWHRAYTGLIDCDYLTDVQM